MWPFSVYLKDKLAFELTWRRAHSTTETRIDRSGTRSRLEHGVVSGKGATRSTAHNSDPDPGNNIAGNNLNNGGAGWTRIARLSYNKNKQTILK